MSVCSVTNEPVGKPIVTAAELEPYLPKVPGEKKRSMWTMVKIVGLALPKVPAFYRNRPSVVDAKVEKVRDFSSKVAVRI